MRALPLALMVIVAFPAAAATLRGGTTLTDQQVRLSDLFDGVDNDRVIGPSPDPGGRIIVESAQLGAIARQFSVDWRPSSTADRIVLDRPGRPFSRDLAVDALRDALSVAGVATDAEVEMPGFTPPIVPTGATGTAEVGQLDYNSTSGQFTAVLSVTAPGMSPAHTRLSGRVSEMVAVPVAVHRMMPGDIIGPNDLQIARLHANAVRSDVAQAPAQAIGMTLRHPVGPGAPIPVADLARPQMVQKGEAVQMRLETPGIQLIAQGIAMDGGAMGEHVRVLNASSRAIVDAEVLGTGRVRVSGTTPVVLPAGASMPVRLAAR
ncbi:flagellar basal body P-ring formation chaperone FlgA [Acidisphaera sp. L21]|uniref:flagellar basal body P-ring formation chaperone FlgA n=1 Tax=Acidisphaera sp. L21 TaxID=1641851 RepID=UPI00131D9AB3|nr:flagellar basal body P-ring formation chaperone FlgA [Acidisphaera sp. L21]